MKIELHTNNRLTTISIAKDTKAWLLKHALYGDSMDKLMRRLLESYEKHHRPRARDAKGKFVKR